MSRGVTDGAMKLGNYEFLYDLASGGMGSVHVARQAGAAGFERLVVIKRVHRHLLQDREFRDRFQREARISAAVRHPNVVSVIDVVESGDELFLVLEYVESISLAQLIRAAKDRGTRLPKAVASRILCDALAGLHAAHETVDLRGEKLDLIHRDVSPQNIIVGVDGSSRIIDFGVAKAAAHASSTQSGQVVGKLSYLSPEQVKRLALDRRADVFAAGVTLFEALTAKRMFRGEDEGDILIGILAGEPPSVSGEWGDSDEAELDGVLAKALERDREERYQTAEELREALERAVPPANTRDVANVVRDLGEQSLSERRVSITRQVLSDSRVPSPPAPAKDLPTRTMPLATATDVDVSDMAVPQPSTKRRIAIAVLVSMVIALAAFFGIPRSRVGPPVTAKTTTPTASTASVTADEPRPSTSSEPGALVPSAAPSASAPAIGRRPARPPIRPAPAKSSDLHKSPY